MNRLKIILRDNHTLHEMLLGIVLINIVPAVIALFVSDTKRALLGVAIGAATAMVYTIHMAVTVDDALCLDEKGAASVMRRQMIIRYLFVCVVVALCSYFGITHPVFLIISVITIKAGAYLQPTIHKFLCRRYDK